MHPQSPSDEFDPFVRLYHGGAHVVCPPCAVEVAGAHQGAALAGEPPTGDDDDDHGSPVTWGEHVTDEEYAAAPQG